MRRAHRHLARALAAAAAFLSGGPAAADEGAALRARFRASYEAAIAGVAHEDDRELRSYVLYPYLRAARLEYALSRAQGTWETADTATAELLVETVGQPLALATRRAWLTSLARRASWAAFLEHYDGAATTPALECQRFNARIARDDTEGLAAEIRTRWLTGRRLPSECEPAFRWLATAGGLPDGAIAQRVELLLDNGQASFARTVAARLPREAAAPLLLRADFIEHPARMLDAWLRGTVSEAPTAVVLAAWARLARVAPQEAATRYAALAARLTTRADRDELSLALAKGLAWDREVDALEYFGRVSSGALDDVGREWWVRSALWAGDWNTARDVLARMPAAQQSDWAWRYWAARAAAESGDDDTAETLYEATLGGDNYYSAMAAARLDRPVVPRLDPLPVDETAVTAIGANAAFQRVRELALVGLRELATNEWRHAYAALPAERRAQAIHLAAAWEIYDVAIATATTHGLFNDYPLLYPRPFATEVAAAAKLTAVEPPLLYGVLRQESLFRADAASSAGALGIAQLTPATARETAQRWKLPAPSRMDLFVPAVGITLGAARVAELLARFDAEVPLALGAYNAGEAAAKRWLPRRPVERDVWIENIPYNETRAYVRRVLWHSLVFRWLESGEPQSTQDWLGRISATAPAG
jgi:soluble lytic murein transglycosylase